MSQNLFFLVVGGGGGRIYFDLSFLLSFSPFSFFSGYIQVFFGTLSIYSLSHGISAAITFQKQRKSYLQKRSR